MPAVFFCADPNEFMRISVLSKCVAGLAIPLLAVWLTAGEQPWQELASLPEPNGGFICGESAGAIFVVGGTNWTGGQKHWLRTVHRLDLATLRWSSLEPLPQSLAYALGGSGAGGLLIAGGSTGSAVFTGVVRVVGEKVTFDANNGIKVPAVLSFGGLVGDELVWVGGTDDAANAKGFRRDAYAWNVHTGQQRALAPYPGPASGLAAAAVAGDELFAFGGAGWDTTTGSVANLTVAYAYAPRQDAWRRLSPLPYAVRGLAAVRVDDQHIYLAGGYTGDAKEFTGQAFLYDISQDRYTPAAPLPYSGCVSLVASGDFVYCLGGEDQQRHRSAAVYRSKVSALIQTLGRTER